MKQNYKRGRICFKTNVWEKHSPKKGNIKSTQNTFKYG